MAKQIACPQCQAAYSIPEEQIGRRVKCKKCETVFTAGAQKVEDDLPAAKVLPAKEPKREEPRLEEVVTRRKTSPARDAGRSRRSDRYDDEVDDYRPRVRKPAKGGISALALFLIIGGVLGSIVVLVGGGILLYFWTGYSSGPSSVPQPVIVGNQNPFNQGGFFPRANDNDADDEENPGNQEPHKDVDVKKTEPPAPPPRELVFVSPPPREAANAPKAPANVELAQDVVDLVKKATVHLRVVMGGSGGMGQGSGFFALEPNLILTNAHVVGMLQAGNPPPKSIEVEQNGGTRDERRYPAELIGVDRDVDLAVLRVKAANLPPPLQVKSALRLRDTQRIWVVGYPLGDSLGKEVTLSDGTVTSIRRDENDVLSKVQVQGGMQPGNSGGPVIDALGNVVGVSVSILRTTTINFAVPGDCVHALATGRISRLTLGQPYLKDGTLKLPVTMQMIDPLKHVREPGIEVWCGKANPGSRPATSVQPALITGDTSHERQPLAYKDETAQGDITLPALPTGSVYWIQPAWGEPRNMQWATGQACELPPPVEPKSVLLTLKLQAGSRNVTINKWQSMKVSDQQRGEYSVVENEESNLGETIQAVDANQETANLALQFRKYKVDLKVQNTSPPPDPKMHKMLQELKNLKAFVTLDKEGNPTGRDVNISKVPEELKAHMTHVHGSVEQMFEGLLVPFPNKRVSPGDFWQAERIFPVIQGQMFSHSSTVSMNYTFLGTRKRDGREEAVVGLKGQVAGGKDQDAKTGAHAEGTAVIDLANGMVVETDAVVSFNSEISPFPGHGTSVAGNMRVRLRRSLTTGSGN